MAAAKDIAPRTLVVAIGDLTDDEISADFSVPEAFTARELDAVLRHALDRQRLIREVDAARGLVPLAPVTNGGEEPAWDGAALTRVLRGITGGLAAGFDLPRVLGMFLDAIAELVHPTRLAVLLPDPAGHEFRIAANRGWRTQLVHSIRLSAHDGLVGWLTEQGRPAANGDIGDPEILRELKLLQAVVAVPLLAHGELVAVLTLGQPVFGAAYGRRQMETLFDLAAHLATALRDITLHHQLGREKEFSERILSHMSSGVVTIGRDQRVGTFNRRAEEILQLPATGVVGQDLRILPSPLGDMLYDTLASGRPVARTEIQLALRRLALEISTYPVRDEDGQPLGAVLVFEDLTAQKELAAQRREAEQFQLLTRVVARIADEIKNPLVSINTFIELIGERYDDPDFRKHFSAVVHRDVRRLVEVFEKLAGLVTEGELHFSIVDAREVVGHLVDAIDLADEATGKHLQVEVVPESVAQPIKVDVGQLRRALSYLVRYLAYNSPTESAPRVALGRPTRGARGERRGEDPGRLALGDRGPREAAAALRSRAHGSGESHRCRPGGGPAPGRGPRRPAAAPSNASRTVISRRPSRDHVTTAAPPLNAARILVVDDELGPRESLRMLLKPAYQIQTADGGRAALEQIPSYRPDVVILDIKMPELDGLEVLRRVKRIDPAIEVVMITAYASLETVKLALTHGAFEYLIKPFSRQDLEDVVRRALERRHAELGARGQVSRLVEEMRRLTAKTRDLEETARREAFEQSLRVTQLSILREISRTIIGQLDPNEITTAVTAQLQTALGYDSITIAPDAPQVEAARAATLVACVIRDAEGRLGYLVADNRPSGRRDRPARARAAGDAGRVPGHRFAQLAAVRRDRRHQALAGAAGGLGRRGHHHHHARRPDRRLESGGRADLRADGPAGAEASDRGVTARG